MLSENLLSLSPSWVSLKQQFDLKNTSNSCRANVVSQYMYWCCLLLMYMYCTASVHTFCLNQLQWIHNYMITWDGKKKGKKERPLRQWKNENWVASGGIWTHDTLQQMLLPTELPMKPSWCEQVNWNLIYYKWRLG